MRRFLLLGLGMAVLTTAAHAAVVVTRLPDFGVGLEPTTVPDLSRYEVDIDGNGTWEVAFEAFGGTEFYATLNDHARTQGFPALNSSSANPLVIGNLVGSATEAPFVWHDNMLGAASMRVCVSPFGCSGRWPTGTFLSGPEPAPGVLILPEPGYLAVEFTNDTGLHYGWIDVGVLGFAPVGYIYGWGWETDPNTAVVIVPEPSQFLLIVSVLAAALTRRRRRT